MKLIINIIFIFLGQVIFSQEKFEREYRIQESEVPKKAILFMEQIHTIKKTRWYAEENISFHSYEAKVKINNHLHSFEFDSTGVFEDVEILMKSKEIEEKVLQAIHQYLESIFIRYKFLKIQMQFSKLEEEIILMVNQKKHNYNEIVKKYEIIVKGKKENEKSKLYEFTFDELGRFLKFDLIVQRNSDNIEF